MPLTSVVGEIETAWGYTKFCLKLCLLTICTTDMCSADTHEQANPRSAMPMGTARVQSFISMELANFLKGRAQPARHPRHSNPGPGLCCNPKTRLWTHDLGPNWDPAGGSRLCAGHTALTLAANGPVSSQQAGRSGNHEASRIKEEGPEEFGARRNSSQGPGTSENNALEFGACAARMLEAECLCSMILLHIMTVRILSLWIVLGMSLLIGTGYGAAHGVPPLDVYRMEATHTAFQKLDPYLRSLLATVLELKGLSGNLLDSPFEVCYPTDNEGSLNSTDCSNLSNRSSGRILPPLEVGLASSFRQGSTGKDSCMSVKDSARELSEVESMEAELRRGVESLALVLRPFEDPLLYHGTQSSGAEGLANMGSSHDAFKNGTSKKGVSKRDPFEHDAFKHESSDPATSSEPETLEDAISLFKTTHNTNTPALEVSENVGEEKRNATAFDRAPEEEEVAKPPASGPKSRKRQPKGKALGFLISSLLKGNSPKREGRSKPRLSSQHLHSSQVMSKARDPRLYAPKFYPAKRTLLSKNRKRKKHRRVYVGRGAKTRQVSTTDQRKCSPSVPKASLTVSEDAKILVVNYRENGLRLVTFLDKNGFQKHLLFIGSEEDDRGFTFDKQFAQVLLDSTCFQGSLFKEDHRVNELHRAVHPDACLPCDSENMPPLPEPNLPSTTRNLAKTTGFDSQATFREEGSREWPKVPGSTEVCELPKESSFVDRLDQCSQTKEPSPSIPFLQDNANFAPRKLQEDRKSSDRLYGVEDVPRCDEPTPKTAQAHTSRPETPYAISGLKSILTDPTKRSPESKLLRQRVSFDFSQPDPLGAEANSYPVLPIYSSGEVGTMDAQMRLRHLFQADTGGVVDDVIDDEYIRLGAGTQVRDLIGDSHRVFEYPGSSYLASYW